MQETVCATVHTERNTTETEMKNKRAHISYVKTVRMRGGKQTIMRFLINHHELKTNWSRKRKEKVCRLWYGRMGLCNGVSIDDKCVAGSWQYSSGSSPSSVWSQNSLNELMEAFRRSLYWNRCTLNHPTQCGWLIYKLTDWLCVWTKRFVCVCLLLDMLCGGTKTHMYCISGKKCAIQKSIHPPPTYTRTQTELRSSSKLVTEH